MKEEITALKHKRCQLQSEAKWLKKSNTQSKWYESKKGKRSSTDSRSTTPKSDTSDYLSDTTTVWKDKLKGQSMASASSSESTLSTPQPTQLSQDTIDLTYPYDSDEHGDEYLDSAPLILLNTSDADATVTSTEPSIAAVTSDTTCTASATLPITPVANASSLTTLTPASVSLTSPSRTSTMLTDSVGVLTTAALVPQLPLSSSSVIEMLLSQSLQPNDTAEKNVETSTHEFSSVASSHASSSSPVYRWWWLTCYKS